MEYHIASIIEDEATHDAKRTKLSVPAEKPTITSRVTSGAYIYIEEAAADLKAVVSSLTFELQQKASIFKEQRLFNHARELYSEISRVSSFRKTFDNLILRERIQRPQFFQLMNPNGESAPNKITTIYDSSHGLISGNSEDTSGRAVLTLYGSAPQPKQLFSSLQQPLSAGSKPSKLQGDNNSLLDSSNGSNSTTTSIATRESIREHALPNGITVTKVIPTHSSDSFDEKKKRKIPTLGELFPSPPTQTPLNPPKQSRHTTTRSSSVNWYNASESIPSSRPHRRDSYSMQPLSTGQWLTYNAMSPPTQASSPETKRKQRDRALSSGETQSELSEEAIVLPSQAKEDALFRRVYSSFAPDRDNAGALIPTYTKNRLWWKRVGEAKYHEVIESNYPPLPGEEFGEVNGVIERANATGEDDFDGVLDDWTPEELPPELKETKPVVIEPPQTTKEVDEILEGISELLETLNSYQRVRNLSLITNTRSSANPQPASIVGTPSSPSSAEFDVFGLLQSQLAMMVSTLPPFALAKLDGDKLGALNISNKIQVQDKHYSGTMEEDEAVVKPKHMSTTPAASYPSRSMNPNLSVPTRSNGYLHNTSTPTQPVSRPNFATQPRPASNAASYLPNQQYSSRPASSNHYFSGTSQSSYSPRPIVNTSERYSYSASQQHNQRPAQSSQHQQSNGYRAYPAQSGPSFSQQYSAPTQGGSSTTLPAQNTQTQRPSQPGYQQRAMNSQSYGSGPSSSVRDTPPSKAAGAFSPQQRSAFPNQGQTSGQARPQLYHQHSTSYGSQVAVPRQVNGASATLSSKQPTHMTAEEQSALMNRQKAQLAEQQITAAKQGSGTPQPTHGHYNGQQNGTPVVQQNGVMTGQRK